MIRRGLRRRHPGLRVEIVGMRTAGDEAVATTPALAGGKAMFTRALEQSLLAGDTDVAVHSMKDVALEMPAGLRIAILPQRGDPRDVLVGAAATGVARLAHGARVGTSSLRRCCQLLHRRPDLEVEPLRGNVQTRLQRLAQGRCDALVLAAAGLKRLGLDRHIAARLSLRDMVPAIGQGALAVQVRADDDAVQTLLAPLHHAPTALCVEAERAFSRALGGDCHAPIAAHAVFKGSRLVLHGMVGGRNGELLRATLAGGGSDATGLGTRLAERLLQRGAAAMMQAWRHDAADGPDPGQA